MGSEVASEDAKGDWFDFGSNRDFTNSVTFPYRVDRCAPTDVSQTLIENLRDASGLDPRLLRVRVLAFTNHLGLLYI